MKERGRVEKRDKTLTPRTEFVFSILDLETKRNQNEAITKITIMKRYLTKWSLGSCQAIFFSFFFFLLLGANENIKILSFPNDNNHKDKQGKKFKTKLKHLQPNYK